MDSIRLNWEKRVCYTSTPRVALIIKAFSMYNAYIQYYINMYTTNNV